MIAKKGDGSHVKESTDSSNTTLEDEDAKGLHQIILISIDSYIPFPHTFPSNNNNISYSLIETNIYLFYDFISNHFL